MPTPEMVRELLSRIPYPGWSRDIVSLGIVQSVEVAGDRVRIALETSGREPGTVEKVRESIRGVLADAGIADVEFRSVAKGPVPLPTAGTHPAAAGGTAPGAACGTGPAPGARPGPPPVVQPRVGRVLGVASGKGGVGKSTVAVNLACALALEGRKVGFLDADIYGPSAPLMFDLEGRKPTEQDDRERLVPLEAHGVHVMSAGFFLERDTALIWRGPLVAGFVRQLITDVSWDGIDDLVIDFPPGTGDAQLTISQALRMDGVLIVTTPNDLALVDAVKGVTMFRKVEVPILGIVENMAWFECPHCGEKTRIFGSGGPDAAAERLGTRVVARIPIDPEVVAETDRGVPTVIGRPESPAARAYRELARQLAGKEARE